MSYLLLESGSKVVLEDASGDLLLESGASTSGTLAYRGASVLRVARPAPPRRGQVLMPAGTRHQPKLAVPDIVCRRGRTAGRPAGRAAIVGVPRPITPITPLGSVRPASSPRRLAPGRVRQGPATGIPTVAQPPPLPGLRPIASARHLPAGRVRWTGAKSQQPTAGTPLGPVRPVASPRRLHGGLATIGRIFPAAAIVPGRPTIVRPVARLATPPRRPRVWMPWGFALGTWTPPATTLYGDTDPDAATLLAWGAGLAPTSMAASDPDAATAIACATAPSSMAVSDPDNATVLP
jgi:hypothetical protein